MVLRAQWLGNNVTDLSCTDASPRQRLTGPPGAVQRRCQRFLHLRTYQSFRASTLAYTIFAASGTSFSVPRFAELAAFDTMSYARVAGRLARTEEGSGVSALFNTQRLAVASALHRIARDPVIRPALLQAMGKTAHGVPDAVSPR